MSKILEALGKLDGNNDNHWTADGLPRIDTVKMLAADQSLTRESITSVSVGFNRTAALEGQAPQASVQAPQVTESKGSTEPAATVAPATVQPATTDETTESQEEVAVVGAEIDYDAEIAHAQDELQVAQAALAEAQALFDAKQEALDDVLNAQNDAGAAETNADAIQGYLASQRRLLQERADRGRALQEAGFTPKTLRDLLPTRSAIDQALARKRTSSGAK